MTITRVDDHTLHLDGRSTFDIRDFGMEPPRILTLRVHPEVVVTVSIVARKSGMTASAARRALESENRPIRRSGDDGQARRQGRADHRRLRGARPRRRRAVRPRGRASRHRRLATTATTSSRPSARPAARRRTWRPTSATTSSVRAAVEHAVATFGGAARALQQRRHLARRRRRAGEHDRRRRGRTVLDVNVTGIARCCRHGIPAMLASGGGSIVNVASFVAHMGAATPQIAYTASKGAVVAMTREIADDLRPPRHPGQRACAPGRC